MLHLNNLHKLRFITLTYAGFDIDLLPAEVVTEILHPAAATTIENKSQELRFLDPESLIRRIRPVGRFRDSITKEN
jgi:hypothetical protein